MKKEHSSRWRKLDNAAQAFPAATGKKDTRVFRFYCQLKEDIQADLLQKALEETMEHYPVFSMVLRKGLFWFYLEQRDLPAKVEEEKRPPTQTTPSLHRRRPMRQREKIHDYRTVKTDYFRDKPRVYRQE